ncbi:MAG: hypothetical protein IJV43_03495 [Oscillospiraceae bacterium]|nr:hypothetical protein [Oscillospiraceae bacterium]
MAPDCAAASQKTVRAAGGAGKRRYAPAFVANPDDYVSIGPVTGGETKVGEKPITVE